MRCAGFTLPEMMVATAVGSIMLAGLLVTSTSLQRWFLSASAVIDSQQDQATMFDYMARDIRRASACEIQNTGTKLVLTIPDQTARAPDSTLQAPTFVTGGLRYGSTPSTVSYYLQPGNAFVREDSSGVVTLASNVYRFSASPVPAAPQTSVSGPLITLDVTFNAVQGQSVMREVATTIRWRNYPGYVQ